MPKKYDFSESVLDFAALCFSAWRKQAGKITGALADGFLGREAKTRKNRQKTAERVQKMVMAELGKNLTARLELPAGAFFREVYEQFMRFPKTAKKSDSDFFGFDDFDQDALDTITQTFLKDYLRNYHGTETGDILAALLERYFKEGMTNWELAAELENVLSGVMKNASKQYFSILADTLATKTASWGQVAFYERSGAANIEIVAVMDENTTEICKAMHGTIIPVPEIVRQRNLVFQRMKDGDPDGAHAAQPFARSGDMKRIKEGELGVDELKALGYLLPPYHFRCRTTTVEAF